MTVAQQEDNGFVVHKGRGVPTLASLQQQQQQQQDPLMVARLRTSKEKSNADSKAEERGESEVDRRRRSRKRGLFWLVFPLRSDSWFLAIESFEFRLYDLLICPSFSLFLSS